MNSGLTDITIAKIRTVFTKFPEVETAILYGSRAKGNYKNGSDIDITLQGKSLTLNTIFKIENEIDDLLLPYSIDLSIMDQITNADLINHIKRVGIIMYDKEIQYINSKSIKIESKLQSSGILIASSLKK